MTLEEFYKTKSPFKVYVSTCNNTSDKILIRREEYVVEDKTKLLPFSIDSAFLDPELADLYCLTQRINTLDAKILKLNANKDIIENDDYFKELKEKHVEWLIR